MNSCNVSSIFVLERGSTMGTIGRNSSSYGNVTDTAWELGSHEMKLTRIMILVFLMTFLLVFLAVFGAWRRKSRLLLLQVMLWTSYTTSVALIPYILGLIQEAPFKNEFLIIWGMLLLIVYAFPDSFSAYSPEDVMQWRMNYVQILSKFGALAILWVRVHSRKLHLDFVVMCLFTSIMFLKVVKRTMAHIFASPHSIEDRAKFFEVYMTSEHNLSNESNSNPVTMEGYHYLVAITGSTRLNRDNFLEVTPSDSSCLTNHIKMNNVVTLEKVWQCQGRLLTENGNSDNRLKDICMSYSLLKLLYLKCAGSALPEEVQPKVRKLILDGLLYKNEKDRAFRVIEVELKLLYELIYTRYRLFASPIFAVLRVLEFVLCLAFCGLSASYISKNKHSLGSDRLAKMWSFYIDVLGTYVLLGMIAFADMAQVWMIFSSEWVKAALISYYVSHKCCLKNKFAEKLIKMVCKPWYWKPWARELRQYSLIESRGYGTKTWISTIASAIYPDKNIAWEIKSVRLCEEVKGAVIDCLRTNGPKLDNGRCSLKQNHLYEQLPGACKSKHLSEDILVWHIATSYFNHKSLAMKNSDKICEDCRITNYLSNYLAYLVAFAPRLLPPPHFEPKFQFRRVMKEVREEFKGCKKAEDMINKLDQLALQEDQEDQKIIVRGARLGNQLLQLENEQHADIWKTLSEFWSEMALCAATSGEVRAHLEKLANGGEFITHLWALLHHTSYPLNVASTMADDQP